MLRGVRIFAVFGQCIVHPLSAEPLDAASVQGVEEVVPNEVAVHTMSLDDGPVESACHVLLQALSTFASLSRLSSWQRSRLASVLTVAASVAFLPFAIVAQAANGRLHARTAS